MKTFTVESCAVSEDGDPISTLFGYRMSACPEQTTRESRNGRLIKAGFC